MSGLDEQFYRCGCGRSYGWFVKDRNGRLIGWLLDPKSPRREIKRAKGIALVHLPSNMNNVRFEEYKGIITYFRCRICGIILRELDGIYKLINFIRRNWDGKTVRRFR